MAASRNPMTCTCTEAIVRHGIPACRDGRSIILSGTQMGGYLHQFSDWTVEQLVSLIACVTGIIMMLMSVRRDSEADLERQAAHAAEQQVITDKLDSISDMSKQLQDHSRELARIETRIEEHDRRLDKIDERLCGTD